MQKIAEKNAKVRQCQRDLDALAFTWENNDRWLKAQENLQIALKDLIATNPNESAKG